MRRHGSAAALWLRADGCGQVLYLPTHAIERANVVRLQKETKRKKKKKSPASSVSAAAARGSCGNEGCCHAAQAKYPSRRQLSQSLSCLRLDGLGGRGGRQTDTRRQRTVKIDAARHQEKANTAEAGTRKTRSDAVSLVPIRPPTLPFVSLEGGWVDGTRAGRLVEAHSTRQTQKKGTLGPSMDARQHQHHEVAACPTCPSNHCSQGWAPRLLASSINLA